MGKTIPENIPDNIAQWGDKRMYTKPELIVMLTYNDITVSNAYEIFEQCKNSKAKYWGFKEEGLPLDEMKRLYSYMKSCGKTTVLEVVAYTEEECLKGAEMAVKCNCDILMGTIFSDSVNDFCKKNDLKYMPFVGKITERPSILDGSIDEMILEGKEYLKKGVFGIDLLGYRYVGDAVELNRRIASEINAPVCIAGSVNSYQRLREIAETNARFFTIGSAFFDHIFGNDIAEQIDKVVTYMENLNA